MAGLPHPYDAYLRLQQQSRNKTKIDSEYWGVDAALEALLAETSVGGIALVDVDRVAGAAARKERHRAALRAEHLAGDDVGDEDAGFRAVAASEELRLVTEQVANDDLPLLLSVAEGESYAALANRFRVTAGSLRVRVSRMRSELLERVA